MAKEKTIYDANAVMSMIGKQNDFRLINNDFYAALNAHRAAGNRDKDLFTVALHFYLFGIICGKKLERAKRGHKDYEPILREASKPQ